MHRSLLLLLGLPGLLFAADPAPESGSPAADPAPAPRHECYELRTYHAAEGKLDTLHERFRNHALKLFERHKMTPVGVWVPVENKENLLVCLLSWPDRAARDASWKALTGDPDWTAMRQAGGGERIVVKIDQQFLKPLDISPAMDSGDRGEPRIFELRTYTTTPGNLPRLIARFRDHTLKLFAKHGMTNLLYSTPADGEPNAENTLIYFLAHASVEARDKSFADFRADPDWQAALRESESRAGGSLTVKDGVKSLLLKPVDYSPLK